MPDSTTSRPATDQHNVVPLCENPASSPLENINKKDENNLGPYALMFFFYIIIYIIAYFTDYNLGPALFDCFFLGLPILWTASSTEILDFSNLKYNQMKYRLGYF